MTIGFAEIISAAFVPFVFFSWGVKGHFRSTGAMPLGMRLVSALSLFAFLWFCARLLMAGVTARTAAVPLFALSLAIFGWAVVATRRVPPTLAFDTDQPALLYRTGPYHYVRHPFYLSYLTFWIGTSIATPGWSGWLTPLIMLLLYTGAARSEERKFANSQLAGAYAAYRAQVGMFLPRL